MRKQVHFFELAFLFEHVLICFFNEKDRLLILCVYRFSLTTDSL